MIILAIVVVSFLVAAWILVPLFRTSQENSAPQTHTNLEERRDTILRSLKELEFDHSTGKIEDAEYAAQRADFTSQATRIFDQLEAPVAPQNLSSPSLALAEREIELEVLVMRARRKSDDWQCARCHRTMKNADRFCASCGAERIQEHVAAPA